MKAITKNEAIERITDASAILLKGVNAKRVHVLEVVRLNEKIIKNVFGVVLFGQEVDEIVANVEFRNTLDLG